MIYLISVFYADIMQEIYFLLYLHILRLYSKYVKNIFMNKKPSNAPNKGFSGFFACWCKHYKFLI